MHLRSKSAAIFAFMALTVSAAMATPTLTTLVNFSGTANGAEPRAGLIADASGNLYGTTQQGGSSNDGTVFKIAPGSNTLTTLATFTGTSNGAGPYAGVIADASGSLYGTTASGGSSNDGTVFKIAAGSNTLNTLATFTGTGNGEFPLAGLIADASGNLYGTTSNGGSSNYGTVFKIAPGSNTLTTLATFTGAANGENPEAGLIADASGNLYGTTESGGSSNDGTVFEIAAGTDTLTTLYSFTGTGSIGAEPTAGVIADASGNLYGTTFQGGSSSDGTVFELSGTGFAVPEPGSLTVAGIGCLALLRRRRRIA